MGAYICRRIMVGILTIWIIVTLLFILIRLIPGDPAEVLLGDYSTPELVQQTRANWDLDKPIWVQYSTYVRNLLQGDLGKSLRMKAPVSMLLARYYPSHCDWSFSGL